MANYKKINKELADQVQMLKGETAIYKQLIVSLRRQLVEEHQKWCAEKRTIITLMANNFWVSLKAIEPNLKLKDVFPEEFPDPNHFKAVNHLLPQEIDGRRLKLSAFTKKLNSGRGGSRKESKCLNVLLENEELDFDSQESSGFKSSSDDSSDGVISASLKEPPVKMQEIKKPSEVEDRSVTVRNSAPKQTRTSSSEDFGKGFERDPPPCNTPRPTMASRGGFGIKGFTQSRPQRAYPPNAFKEKSLKMKLRSDEDKISPHKNK